VDYASVTSIIHCRPCCHFLISCCYQQTPDYIMKASWLLYMWLTWSLFRDA